MIVTYVPALKEDLPQIFRLNKELIDRYEDTDAINYEYVLNWVRQNIEHQLPHFRRILADGELAGFFCLVPLEDRFEGDSLFVLPSFQNRGIGTQVLKYCKEQSNNNMFFYVFRRNQDAIRLYERMGFRIVKEVGTTRYIME